MIDEQETRLQFGYYSQSLSKCSNKEVYVICEGCGDRRIIKFRTYTKTHGRCQSCAHSGKYHTEETKYKMSKARLGKHHTEETKDKISKAHIGKHLSEETKDKLSKINTGKHHTEETKRKISQANIGKHLSEETKDKLSKANTGENHPMFGKHLTEKTKDKISQANSGEKHPGWKGGTQVSTAKGNARRRELFGFIPHNKSQENFHAHHLDFNHVIFIPAELHRSISHSVVHNRNMDLINNAVCDWYLEFQGVKL